MIAEMLDYLRSPNSPLAGRPFTLYRDDGEEPFSDLTTRPVVLRVQGAPKDRDLSRAQFDLWICTAGNADGAAEAALFDTADALELYVIENFTSGQILSIEVVSGAAGPFRDGQGRSSVRLTFDVIRNTGG